MMSVETVGIESSLQQKDVVGEVIADEEYDKRIEMEGDILNTDLPTIVKRSKGVVMSTGFKEDGTTCKLLPPSAKFPELFVNYVGELTAAPGSCRASNPKNRQPHWRWASCLLDPRSRSVTTTRVQGSRG